MPAHSGYHVEEHGSLLLVHGRSFQTFWLDGFAVLAWAEDEIGQAVAENGLFLLRFVEGVQEGEGLVAFRAERANGFSVAGEESGLRAGESWRKDAAIAGDGDIEREVVAAELEHPGIFFGRRSEDGDVVEIFAEHGASRRAAERWTIRAVSWLSWRWTGGSAGRWSVAITGWRRIAIVAAWRLAAIGGLEDFVAFHDLLNLFEAFCAEGCGD